MDRNSKTNRMFEIIAKQEYLIVQGNDLAKAFGNLKAFEHKVLDYCFSMVTKNKSLSDSFYANSKDILECFGLNFSGQNYERVANAFKFLNENTALYFVKIRETGQKSIVMTQLFSKIEFFESGKVEFKFSEYAAPYIFDLKNNFYSFHLRELENIKSKYSLILMKIWEANRYGKNELTIIEGTLDEWQDWFLGKDKKLSSAVFKRDILFKAAKELEQKLNAQITLTTIKDGRKVTGYEMRIVDNRIRK